MHDYANEKKRKLPLRHNGKHPDARSIGRKGREHAEVRKILQHPVEKKPEAGGQAPAAKSERAVDVGV